MGGLSNRALERVYDALHRAAEAGVACPGNTALAVAMGYSSRSSGTEAVGILEDMGRIVVERFPNWRVVTIRATGKQTAPAPGSAKPLVRVRAATEPRAPTPPLRREAMPISGGYVKRDTIDPETLPPVVDRDPCGFCGTRADLHAAQGCGRWVHRVGVS